TNDHRIAAAKLERHSLDRLSRYLHDMFACRCCAGKTDFANSRISQDRLTNDLRWTGDDIEDTRRQAGIVHDPNSFGVRKWSGSGGLHHYRVSTEQRGTDLVAEQRQWKVPRHDGAANADRLFDDDSEAAVIELRHVSAANAFRHSRVVFQRM